MGTRCFMPTTLLLFIDFFLQLSVYFFVNSISPRAPFKNDVTASFDCATRHPTTLIGSNVNNKRKHNRHHHNNIIKTSLSHRHLPHFAIIRFSCSNTLQHNSPSTYPPWQENLLHSPGYSQPSRSTNKDESRYIASTCVNSLLGESYTWLHRFRELPRTSS